MRKNNSIKKSNNKASTSNGPTVRQTLGHSMTSGFGIGAGLEASRAVFGGLFGGNSNSTESKDNTECKFEREKLEACLNNGNYECKDFMELLNNCYKSQK
tara:strand:+ start:323 stop:622 length:300 start_codon:yes stop_codon:yes gene_type:complete